MRVIALDISTQTGYARFDGGVLSEYGTFEENNDPDYGLYPWSYINRARSIADRISAYILAINRDEFSTTIVIEETNKAKARYTQKLLEFIHFAVLTELEKLGFTTIKYINTSDWRKTLDVSLSKEDKKINAKLSKAKSEAKKKGVRLDKKKLGIKGKINKKHKAVLWVNRRFNISLKMKDNNTADAICLGQAFLDNAPVCDGT